MLNAERRPSVAERRSSFLSGSLQNSMNIPVVPHLAGIEDPLPETTPDKVDVLIAGTGMVESVLAAALAWQGSSVLHIDKNDYYGDTSATLTIDQISNWVNEVNSGTSSLSVCYTNAKLYISKSLRHSNTYVSRDFGIDLSPKILFAKSDLLSILVKSRVHQYLEFQSLSNFHTYENDSFEKLTNTKQEIFTDQNLSLMSKRNLMRFIKFVLVWDEQPEIWQQYAEKPISDFLVEKFKLENNQLYELIFSIGLCYNLDVKTPNALQRIRRYLTSFDVYGPFPVLYSKFGGPGELSQGFCRSAAVAGSTYKLNSQLLSFNPTTKEAVFKDGSKIKVEERVIVSPTQAPLDSKNIPKQEYEVHRLTCIVEKSCSEWFGEGESAAVVVFPPNSLKSNNRTVVQAFIVGSGTESCAKGTCIWYLSTVETGPRAELDLDAALEALERSIIRESSTDLENENDLIQLGPNGQTIINSVKLGQSFKEYIPREKVQFLLKLYYTQFTSTPPFDVVTPSVFEFSKEWPKDSSLLVPGASDNNIVYTSMPCAEISYDDVITAAKVLYEKIVGSDDDFFDVDFEDEDIPTYQNNGDVQYQNTFEEDDEEDEARDMDIVENEEPMGEMEI
ncbi:hypothetical protein TPHA_0H03060 [Tetrapisispora phaffii CBS 4417]|uniref:Rab proteins geranylgeranyltransferase component A n=1 Tax=Tetrapisispora phaffii (strain ATCC 24235 / CBS 4417 / NBRC 1672 / NRRL Y-8282 / UCD 70-5) TaxID=1071381 RepID=G8BWQ8_TETPH|nr:hypothetical protein TPHA_0H03060 [Tetrapisispora phaffii CBS 4417]CCE64509.1 hypothetical protein TPHA_0H03060 [Tetrapisispora phaffii CBS 4417]